MRSYVWLVACVWLCQTQALELPDCSRVPRGWEAYFENDGRYNSDASHETLWPFSRSKKHFLREGHPPEAEEKRKPFPVFEFEVAPGRSGRRIVEVFKPRFFRTLPRDERARFERRGGAFGKVSVFAADRAGVPFRFLRETLPVRKVWCGRWVLSHETYHVWDPNDLSQDPFSVKPTVYAPADYATRLGVDDDTATQHPKEVTSTNPPHVLPGTMATNDYVIEALGQSEPDYSYYPEIFSVRISTGAGKSVYGNVVRSLEAFPKRNRAGWERIQLAVATGEIDLFAKFAQLMGISRKEWVETQLLPKYMELYFDALYVQGMLPELHTQNLEMWVDPQTGELKELTFRDGSDVVVAPFLRELTRSPNHAGLLRDRFVNVLNAEKAPFQVPLYIGDYTYSTDMILALSHSASEVEGFFHRAAELLLEHARDFIDFSELDIEVVRLDRKEIRHLAFSKEGQFAEFGVPEALKQRHRDAFSRLWGHPAPDEQQKRRLELAAFSFLEQTTAIHASITGLVGLAAMYQSEGIEKSKGMAIFANQRAKGLVFGFGPYDREKQLIEEAGGWDSDKIRFSRSADARSVLAIVSRPAGDGAYLDVPFAVALNTANVATQAVHRCSRFIAESFAALAKVRQRPEEVPVPTD